MKIHQTALLLLAACSLFAQQPYDGLKPTTMEEKTILSGLQISSKAFENGKEIPAKYTCDGANINPPLHIGNLPAGTKSLALIVDDPDAPSGNWDHWLVWNIPPVHEITENSIPGTEGVNDFQKHHYGGPCPPKGVHRYHFKVYALNGMLGINADSRKKDLLKAMEGHILASGDLLGKYERHWVM